MSGFVPRTVRGRVVFLICVAFLPSIAVSWYAYGEVKSLAVEATEQELLRAADVTASDFEGMVDEGRAMLFALAQNEEVGRYERPACDLLLGRVLAASPRYTALAVIDPDGYRVCGAVSLENPLYLGDRSYVIRATGSRRFAVGDYQVGRITGKPTVGLAYPVYDDEDGLVSVLATTLDLTLLAENASEAQLPADATYTLSDLSGNVLVRYPPDTAWVGSKLPATFPAAVDPDPSMTEIATGEDLDGLARLFAVAPLRRPGGRAVGYLAVGVPEAAAAAPLARILGTELSLLAFSLALLVLAAWAMGHYSILARTDAIVEAERRLAEGDLSARTGVEYGDDELGRLARTFDEMAAKLEERDHAATD